MTQEEREAKLEQRQNQIRSLEAFKNFAASPDGEIVLKELEAICFANRTTFAQTTTGAVDPLQTAVHEGRRQIWMYITAKVNVANDNRVMEQLNTPIMEDEDVDEG